MELGATSENKNTTFLLAFALFYSAENKQLLFLQRQKTKN
jgi:hypothetical protein